MQKNIRFFSVLTAIVLGLAFFSTRPAHAADLCVNPGGTSGCYASIQAAIDAAANGDTIHVEPGDYTGNLVVNKTLAILGDNEVDIFDADPPGAYNIHGVGDADTIQITAGGVLIRGFRIYGYQTTTGVNAAIRVTGVNQATIYDSIIETPDIGIAVTTSSLVYIYDNGIYGDYISVGLASTGVVVQHNDIAGCASAGIYAEGNSDNNTIEDNYILNNSGNGIYLSNTGGYTITDNIINDNGQNGIELFGSNNNVITGNEILYNDLDGIHIREAGAAGLSSPNDIHLNNFNNDTENLNVEVDIATIDAERNWWGTADEIALSEKLVGDINYKPWCINETCTAMTIYNVTQDTYHTSIQGGIDSANPSDVLAIEGGTYVENVFVWKPVEIAGAGQTETFILPMETNPNCSGAGGDRLCDFGVNVFLVEADGVIIHDLTVDGDNPDLESGLTIGNADIDARNGIIGNTLFGDYDITVNNVTAKNLYMTGIMSTGPGSIFTHNTVTNVRGDTQSVGIGGSPVEIHGSTISYTTIGVGMDSGVDTQIDGNIVTYSNAGIMSLNSCSGGTCTTGEQITGNSISDCTGTGWGIVVSANHEDVNVEGNQVQRCLVGLTASGSETTAPVTFIDNTVVAPTNPAGSYGAYLTTNQVTTGTSDVYANFTDNSISGFATGVFLYDPNHLFIQTVFLHNQLTGNAMQVNVGSVGTIASSFESNWWGSTAGPALGSVYSGLDFAPWCGNAACSTLIPTAGVIEIPTGTAGSIVQQYLGNAPQITEIRFLGSPGPLTGGFAINTPRLTILLRNGTVIQNNSPCFVINADYTTIMTESVGGASCIPTSGSNGIDINGSRVNIVIQGLEFPGTAGGDGIHFAGSLNDTVLVNNWFHDLTGDGIDFTVQPTGTVNIQGNLFQNNGGLGINSPGSVGAEFNSWGSAGGASSGDGVSPGVIADPYTHVDLYLVSSETARLNQVLTGQTITYTIYAHMVNTLAVDFWLQYPTGLTLSGTPVSSGTFDSYAYFDTSVANAIHFYGMATWDESYGSGGGFRPVTGTVPIYSATFTAGAPASPAAINLNELTDKFAMEAFESSTNIYAAALVDGTVEILDSYTVTGTVSMQGRLTYADVPAVLTNTETPPWGPYETISFDEPLDNLIFDEIAGGIYRITTNQPRYLNVTADLNKTFTTTGDRSIAALALRGGNAQWSDNIINVGDAGVIGAAYGTGDITSDGDVNFDDVVNIADLAIVGGNFYLTSSAAYSSWTP